MFLVTGAAYVIRCTFGFLAARITGIRSSASSGITMRAVSFEGFHKIHSTGRCGRRRSAPPGTKNGNGIWTYQEVIIRDTLHKLNSALELRRDEQLRCRAAHIIFLTDVRTRQSGEDMCPRRVDRWFHWWWYWSDDPSWTASDAVVSTSRVR